MSGGRRTRKTGRRFRLVGASLAAAVTLGGVGVALDPAIRTLRSPDRVATLGAPVRLAGSAADLPSPEPTAAPHATVAPQPSPEPKPAPSPSRSPVPTGTPATAAAAGAAPTQGHRHPLPTVTEPGVGGATWNVLDGWANPVDWPTRGTVVSTTVRGATTGLSEPAYVYLPPAYFQPATAALGATGQGRRDLPMTVVFTGYPGDNGHLITRQHYPDAVAAGIASGTIAQTVLLMISPAATFPWDTECSDIPGGPRAFTFYSREAPDAAATEFGLRPKAYASIGDSTGGYCAAKLESIDPGRFGVAVALSGYFSPATDRTTRGTFGDKTLRNTNDLGWRLAHRPVPNVQLLLATAQDERGADGYATNQAWMRLVRSPMTADELVLAHGGHNSASWDREIPYAMSWISARLPHDHVHAAAQPTDSEVATSDGKARTGTARASSTWQPATVAPGDRTRRRSRAGRPA
ncbi:MAG TPA: alpha/beta hydrolase-fold protein [Sporichthyaceae bacterium]|nr:alpha/beta hydrolase-fold protein [Sporichthyaceae bacterium]